MLDKARSFLHVSNYTSGMYCIFSIDKETGLINDTVFQDSYGKGSEGDVTRQMEAHAHGAYIVNDFSYVADLGADKIWIYKVNLSTFLFLRSCIFTSTLERNNLTFVLPLLLSNM